MYNKIMIRYNKNHSYIIRIEDNNKPLIIKLSKNEKNNSFITYEYYIYRLIDHKSFKSFNTLFNYNNINFDDSIKIYDHIITVDKLFKMNNYDYIFPGKSFNILLGNYNNDMITLLQFCKPNLDINLLINIYINILNILDECYIKYNFIHGDMKSNNILIDQTDSLNNIQLIDFEFSLIFSDEIVIINDNNNYPIMNNYLDLDDESCITKEFAKLFDIYTLCVDLIYNNKVNLKIFKYNLEQKQIETPSFIDFYIIYSNIYMIPRHNFKEDNYLNLSFKSIIKNLSHINMLNYTELIKNRIIHINKVLDKMSELNLVII